MARPKTLRREENIRRGVDYVVSHKGQQITREELCHHVFGGANPQLVLRLQRSYLSEIRKRLELEHHVALKNIMGIGWITTDGMADSVQLTVKDHRRAMSALKSRDRKAGTINVNLLSEEGRQYYERFMKRKEQTMRGLEEEEEGIIKLLQSYHAPSLPPPKS